MSTRIALPRLILAALAALSLPCPAAAGPWGLAPGEWYSTLEGSVFTSKSSYDATGARVEIGQVVEQRAMRAYSELGWKQHVSIVFSLPVMSVTRRDASVQGTATGFQDVLLGLRYSIMAGKTAVSLQTTWSGPTGYNRNLDSLGLQLGDGLQELSQDIRLGTALSRRGFLQAAVGYQYRFLSIGQRKNPSSDFAAGLQPIVVGDHPSHSTWADNLVASGDLGIWIGPSLLVSGRYRGAVTLTHGALLPGTALHLAGPEILYRVDDRLDMFAGSWSAAGGKNALHFDQVYVGVAFHKTKLNRLQGFLGGKQAP